MLSEMLVVSATKGSDAPKSGEGVRLAVYQGAADVGTAAAVAANISRADAVAARAKSLGAQLLSFPELYLSGYALNAAIVPSLAEPFPSGPSLRACAAIAAKHRLALVMPYPERDGDRFYDSIAIIGADGSFLGNYRKTHLFGNSERELFSAGDGPFVVADVNGFRVGVLNCYEAEIPELSRIVAILGARLIVIPTAADTTYTLSSGVKVTVPYPDVSHTSVPVRAFENNVFVCYSNRMGRETVGGREWEYQGNSIVCGPDGKTIVEAPHTRETLLVADVVPSDFGPTHPENTDFLRDLRPELFHKYYEMLADKQKQQQQQQQQQV